MKRPHPLVRELLEELDAQLAVDSALRTSDVTDAACIARSSIANWRRGNEPRVSSLDRAFRVLGYRLAVVPLVSDDAEKPQQKPRGQRHGRQNPRHLGASFQS